MKRFATLVTAAAIAGCTSLAGPPLDTRMDMPGAFREGVPADAVALSRDWWKSYGSAELSQLIDDALRTAPDLAIAEARVREAEAQARIAGASLFPVISASASSSRSEARAPSAGRWSEDESTRGAISASYEIDFWGRNASGARAGQLGLQASRFDLETARLTLVSGVASAYFQVLSLRGRLEVARENLAIAERVLKLVTSRVKFGANSQLDLVRQQSAVLSQRAGIPPLEQQERQTLAALAILTGRTPQSFDLKGVQVADISVPAVTPGLPADVLVRRPDLASAEAILAAAHANVGAARAAMLPSIQLTGSGGLATGLLLDLASPVKTVSIGLSLLQVVFDGGRLGAQADLARGREEELLESYRKAILAALADVENALVATNRSREQETLQGQARDTAQRALQLAELRYKEGADDLLTVLDAQRTLFQAQDQFAQIRLARLQASVGLFKALGGGWEMPPRAAQAATNP
jgi:NodT family efflux transporter outer membrane factor (OMF) lipoprotein